MIMNGDLEMEDNELNKLVCIQDKIIESIKGVGMPSLKELMENILNEKVPIYI